MKLAIRSYAFCTRLEALFFFSKYLFKGEFVKRGKKTDLFFFPALVQPARSLANTEGYSPCAASVRTLAASALLPV